jgi:hypothetical protein
VTIDDTQFNNNKRKAGAYIIQLIDKQLSGWVKRPIGVVNKFENVIFVIHFCDWLLGEACNIV